MGARSNHSGGGLAAHLAQPIAQVPAGPDAAHEEGRFPADYKDDAARGSARRCSAAAAAHWT
jgi:hypothetical protein